jgi:predicted DNA-binding transcriptional regulator AlpA
MQLFLEFARLKFAHSLSNIDTMVETREAMDIREALEYLGISHETLYKYVYEERIPAHIILSRGAPTR